MIVTATRATAERIHRAQVGADAAVVRSRELLGRLDTIRQTLRTVPGDGPDDLFS